MTPLSHLAVVQASGADAGAFLHAQLSADVAALEPGQSLFGCYCNPQGRVLDLLMVINHQDGFLLLTTSERVDDMLKRMRMFVMRSNVSLETRPDLVVYGVTEDELPQDMTVIARPQTGLVYAIGKAMPTPNEDPDAWRNREFEAGVLWLNARLSGQFLPQWLGFDRSGAVNFRKGCFPGQEVIARMRYLGKVKRLPLLVWLDKHIDLTEMDKVNVRSGESETTAVVAGSSRTAEGSLCYLVVRNRDTLEPCELVSGQDARTVQRWATI
jgi:folate-binding protein YgfZ